MKHQFGFSLLESMLAIAVMLIAGLGVYSLFQSGRDSYQLNDATQEMVEIANVFTDLASADLTTGIEDDTNAFVSLLQNSGRLPSRYFATINANLVMVNPFAPLAFDSPTPYSFSVEVPLGCLDKDSTVPEQFCNALEDLYTCGGAAPTTDGCQSYVRLAFNLTG